MMVVLFAFAGCNSNRSESSAVEFSMDSSVSSRSESSNSFRDSNFSEDLSSSSGNEQDILDLEELPPTPAPTGEPNNFTELPSDSTKILPFAESQIKEIEFFTLPPKYGTFRTSSKSTIKEIVDFINEIQMHDTAPPASQKVSIIVIINMKDGTNAEVELFDDKIYVNGKLYPADVGDKYPMFENMLDNYVMQSYADKGLLSIKGTFASSMQIDDSFFLCEIDTGSILKTIQVKKWGTTITLLNVGGTYPWDVIFPTEKKQTVTVFYEKESNPIVPEAVFIY